MRTLRFAFLMVVFLSAEFSTKAQTYTGAINGTVTDPSGAVIPNAEVKAKAKATDITRSSTTTSDGEFAFQDLPIGSYAVIVNASGFPELTIDNVTVTEGSIYTLPVKPPNSAADGLEGNPADPSTVSSYSAGGFTWQPQTYIFPGITTCVTGNVATDPNCGTSTFGIYSVSQNFRAPYFYNYNLQGREDLGKFCSLPGRLCRQHRP